MSLVKILSRAVTVPAKAGMQVQYNGLPAVINDWTEGSRRVYIRQFGKYLGVQASDIGLTFR